MNELRKLNIIGNKDVTQQCTAGGAGSNPLKANMSMAKSEIFQKAPVIDGIFLF